LLEELALVALLAVILILLLAGGMGLALHGLWWIALTLLVLWLVGFIVRGVADADSRSLWYRW
jgi:hypothetical protein